MRKKNYADKPSLFCYYPFFLFIYFCQKLKATSQKQEAENITFIFFLPLRNKTLFQHSKQQHSKNY